jgi:hypothetical protein
MVVVIKAWKEQVIIAKSRGFTDIQCCHSANVNHGQLMRELAQDAAFKTRYDEAAANAPKPPTW